MAEAADTAPGQQPARVATTTTASDVSASAWLQQVLALLFPSNLAAKAALFALVVALLPLLPSGQAEAPRIWELPHLLLLGIIISYGVFGQKNADAEVAAAANAKLPVVVDDEAAAVEAYVSQMMQGSLVFEEHDGGGDDDGASKGGGGVQQAWTSQYLPDDPLVVVADTSGSGTNSGNTVITDTGEKPLLLPHAIPSPSSVLDADLTLSPSSPPLLPPPPPPPPPPFLGRGRRSSLLKAKARSFNEFGALSSDRSPNASLGSHSHSGAGSKQFRSRSAVQATRSAFGRRYDPVVPIDDETDDETLGDEMDAASDSSFSSDLDDDDAIKEENSCEDNGVDEDDGDDNSCDEELFELAMRPGPEGETETEVEEVEDEVDRKADEFIAKFREQIRMQRGEPARR
ncbi:unnamed protein product [Miscanthus lutarioriparius]|uniref:Uncharacterized protein n=1 Tax=Miscanthus lutarioriparius TaxID=422564 RepID=A0A811QQM9_9POAL|nr:unnamed protein product [Miscanthus lutarioriparius]